MAGTERDEVGRHHSGSLVEQLIKSVLTVGAGFAPYDGAGFGGDGLAIGADLLAVAFHRKLLQVGGKAVEVA